jgi:hypothetical protein
MNNRIEIHINRSKSRENLSEFISNLRAIFPIYEVLTKIPEYAGHVLLLTLRVAYDKACPITWIYNYFIIDSI